MIRLIVLYRRPDDIEAFMEHYTKVHMPLARQIPGLSRMEVMRVTADASGGEPPYFLIAVLSFPDLDTFDAAMRSEEGRAAAEDVTHFAEGLATVMISHSLE